MNSKVTWSNLKKKKQFKERKCKTKNYIQPIAFRIEAIEKVLSMQELRMPHTSSLPAESAGQ